MKSVEAGVGRALCGALCGALWLLVGNLGFAADGEVFTWRDAQGRVHYGTEPPAQQPATAVQLNAKPESTPVGGRIYSWTDATGRVHYSARPPEATPTRQLQEQETPLSTIRATGIRPGEQRLLQQQR